MTVRPGRRLLIVVQRYGEEVVGGAEQHARAAARRLARANEVEIATTTALDYWSWAPHYAAGEDEVDGLRVRRFPVASGRSRDFKDFERRVLFQEHGHADEWEWLCRQGPHAPALLEFLHREGARYRAVVFYTYIYAPTALGLPLVPERAALVPTTHDELPLGLAPYRALFHLPRAIGYLTPEERDLVQRRFRNEQVPHEVLGVGLDPPGPHDARAFRERHRLAGPLVVYLGQVSEGKGCDELLAHWAGYRARAEVPHATLVLGGTVRMAVPERPDVVALGRVSDEEKYALLAAADVVVLPSHLESLGIVLLEAWQVGTPVLVRASNAVTAGQVARAQAGLSYGTGDEFAEALATLLREGRARGGYGRAYVARECSWDAFDRRLARLVDMAAFDA
ncbi:MAG: glycosyltransferase family 4 protein [Candidatus Limnocylindria bacterium]